VYEGGGTRGGGGGGVGGGIMRNAERRGVKKVCLLPETADCGQRCAGRGV